MTIKDSGDATGTLQSKSWSLKVLTTNVTTFTVTLNLSGTQGSPIPPVAYVVLEIKDSSNKVVASSSTASNPTTQKLSLSVKKEDIKNMGDWTITLRTDGSAPGGQAGIFHWEIFAVYIP